MRTWNDHLLCDAYCHFSYTQVCWADVVVLHISVTDAWKTNFIFNPIHTYIALNSCFFPLPLLLLNSEQHIWVHFIKMFHVAALSVNAEREHPKLWKLKNLCAWATILRECTRSSASFITWIEKGERGP